MRLIVLPAKLFFYIITFFIICSLTFSDEVIDSKQLKSFILIPFEESCVNEKFIIRYIIPKNYSAFYRIIDNENNFAVTKNLNSDVLEKEYNPLKEGIYSVSIIFYNEKSEITYIENKSFKIIKKDIDIPNYIYLIIGAVISLFSSLCLLFVQQIREYLNNRRKIKLLYCLFFADINEIIIKGYRGKYPDYYAEVKKIENIVYLHHKLRHLPWSEIFNSINTIEQGHFGANEKDKLTAHVKTILKVLRYKSIPEEKSPV